MSISEVVMENESAWRNEADDIGGDLYPVFRHHKASGKDRIVFISGFIYDQEVITGDGPFYLIIGDSEIIIQVVLVGAGGEIIFAYFPFPESIEVIELGEFGRWLPMSVAVDDGVIVACASAIEFIESKEEGILLAEGGDRLGEG